MTPDQAAYALKIWVEILTDILSKQAVITMLM